MKTRGAISERALLRFCRTYNVDPGWVLTGEEGAASQRIAEPDPIYRLSPDLYELEMAARNDPTLVPWLLGLVNILNSGDPEKASAIKGNIQAFLEALGLPRLVEVRAPPARKEKRSIRR
ncbi:MAG: hypothetical protein ACE5HU_06265 [Acidobacteriota bacterium]